MRFGLIGSRPLHLVPPSSLPLHTLLFPLFFHVLLSSCPVISSFSSFARTLVPALVCTCTSTYLKKEVSGRPGLYNEVGFIGCPCALGFPFHFNHTHLCPVSSSCHVFIVLSLARAHVHICLNLSFTPPLGEACVCVPLVVTGIHLNCFLLSRGAIPRYS